MSAANDNPDATPGHPGNGKGARLFIAAASAVVVAAVSAGLAVSDPPWTSRERALDNNQARNLGIIQRSIEARFKDDGALPVHLADLASPPQSSIIRTSSISASCLPGVDYEVPDPKGREYKLCATFRQESSGGDPYYTEAWKHGKGRTCFALKAP